MRVLLIEDSERDAMLLYHEMQKEYQIDFKRVETEAEFVESLDNEYWDIILSDYCMPTFSGLDALRIFKSRDLNIPFIIISGMIGEETAIDSLKMGANDYILKNNLKKLNTSISKELEDSGSRRMQKELESHNLQLKETVQKQILELCESQMATIFALAKLAESRDDDTGRHLDRVQRYCKLLVESLSSTAQCWQYITPTFIDSIYHASPLHDIGKVGIPDRILLKREELTPEEFEIMKTHTIIGSDTLKAVQKQYKRNAFVSIGIEIARSHHEKWDGTGYPDGLSGLGIPLSARIMSIADVYDSLRSKRCYKSPLSHEEACNIIFAAKGKDFDPLMVDIFKEIHLEFKNQYEELVD